MSSKISRSDIFVRDEKVPAWFDEFLKSLAETKESSTQDILDAIQCKKSETVGGVIEEYRKMVGIDNSKASSDNKELTAKASRPLSIRHAEMLNEVELEEEVDNVISSIEKDPKLMDDIRSLCEHSGGTKNTHAIIDYLREKLGKDIVSYSDNKLVEYIEKAKEEFKVDSEEPHSDVGRVGIDSDDHIEDDVAEYMQHDGNKGSI